MKTLNELFNSPVSYKVTGDEATFTIGDIDYMVDWRGESGPDNDWEIGFGSRKRGVKDIWRIGITKDGNELTVFSTVIDIIKKELIKKRKAFGIIFTAKEANRVKLYRTMAKKIGKGWDLSERRSGSETEFYLARDF